MKSHHWKAGQESEIKELQGDTSVCQRLVELGFTPGEKIKVLHRTPFGDPIVVKVRGTTVALRKSELSCIVTSSKP